MTKECGDCRLREERVRGMEDDEVEQPREDENQEDLPFRGPEQDCAHGDLDDISSLFAD